MSNFIKTFIALSICLYFIFGSFFTVLAATTCREKYLDYTGQCVEDCSSLGNNYISDTSENLCAPDLICCHQIASISLQIPLFDYAKAQDLPQYILTLYQYSLIVIVPLSIIMIIIGGIIWISSAGNQTSIKKAKTLITNSIIGLIIALFSYIFLSLIGINTLQIPGLQPIDRIDGAALQIYEQSFEENLNP